MCYNPQATGTVHNFADTTQNQNQYIGVPKQSMQSQIVNMQLDPDKYTIKNDNFNKLNYINRNDVSSLFGGYPQNHGSMGMTK
jgi:hypothetical protein